MLARLIIAKGTSKSHILSPLQPIQISVFEKILIFEAKPDLVQQTHPTSTKVWLIY